VAGVDCFNWQLEFGRAVGFDASKMIANQTSSGLVRCGPRRKRQNGSKWAHWYTARFTPFATQSLEILLNPLILASHSSFGARKIPCLAGHLSRPFLHLSGAEMEETAAAASALVIAFAGDVSLRAGAVELTRLANNVARAADPVGIPSYGLLEAAEKLWHADDATRENLAQALEAKATILKGEATSRQNNLRQSVASLVHESLKSPLPSTGGVLALSDKVWYATSGLRVHRDALGEAREAIAKVGEDAAARTQALAELVKAATELEEAAGPRLAALVRGAANLALACQEHTRVADAIPVVRRAAEHRRRTEEAAIARQGGTARTWWWRAWWPWNRRVGRGNGTPEDLEKALLVNETESTPTAKRNQVIIWGGSCGGQRPCGAGGSVRWPLVL
jgi:hypothetical protein